MTIEIKTTLGYFDGNSFDKILKSIVKVAEEENDFCVNIESINWNDFTFTHNHLIKQLERKLDDLLLEVKEENDIAKRDYTASLYQDQYL